MVKHNILGQLTLKARRNIYMNQEIKGVFFNMK